MKKYETLRTTSPNLRSASYEEIASWLGITRQSVGNKMHGKTEFTLNEVLTLFDVYGISIWDLKEVIEEETERYTRRKEEGLWSRAK